jgi:pyridoxine kinase
MAILSIQSHVAYGHVGNRSAVFPLERMGFEVWPVNTVQFSNHTGYGDWRGEIFPGSHIDDIWRGVRERGVAPECEAVLSGYLGDVAIGQAIGRALAEVRKANPRALYCCDPVMGDYGRGIYVRPDIPAFLKESALSLADILTPNLFETEILSGIRIGSETEARKACEIIHSRGPRTILITSFRPEGCPPGPDLPGNPGRESMATNSATISMLLSDEGRVYRISTPELVFPHPPNGAGDLASALFLGNYLKNRDAPDALEAMTEGVFSVFEATMLAGARELRIVQCQEAFVTKRRRFRAVEVK